jgi:hypothetical protein
MEMIAAAEFGGLSKNSIGFDVLLKRSMVLLSVAITGCSSLLPNAQIQARTPWHNYAEAHAMFEQVIPAKTTLSELRALGVDPDLTPNISVLAQTDLLRRLIPIATSDIRFIDPQLQECISPQQVCFAYEIEQTRNDRERSGNFWLDVMDFKRVTEISGWKFNAVFVVKNGVVIHKLWTGTPNIRQHEEEFRPLGPLQGLGTSLLGR